MDIAAPVLASSDFSRTIRFYGGVGFEPVDLPKSDEFWLTLRRAHMELNFALRSDYSDAEEIRHDHVAVLRVRDIEAWHERWRRTRAGWKALNPSITAIRDDLWGERKAFAVTDRDGNLIWCIASDDLA